MKATLKQINEGSGALNLLMGAKLPVKAAYAVSKLAKLCQNEMEHFGKQREKHFEDAGCKIEVTGKDKEGNETKEYVHPDGKEKIDAVVKEVEEMMDAEVEISALPLDLEQFKDVELPGAAFFGLDWAMKKD